MSTLSLVVMGITMVRNTILTVCLVLLLLAILDCRRCRGFPLRKDQPDRADTQVHGDGADDDPQKSIHDLKEKFGNGDGTWDTSSSSERTGTFEGEPSDEGIFRGADISDEDTGWASYSPHHASVDYLDGNAYGNYDARAWGSFLPMSWSLGIDNQDDYDPLGGGIFTSDILDPSVSHSVYASSSPVTRGYNSKLNVQPSKTQTNSNPLDTNGIEQPSGGLTEASSTPKPARDVTSQGTSNAVDGSSSLDLNPVEITLLTNMLSSILSADTTRPPQDAEEKESTDISADLDEMAHQAKMDDGFVEAVTHEKVCQNIFHSFRNSHIHKN